MYVYTILDLPDSRDSQESFFSESRADMPLDYTKPFLLAGPAKQGLDSEKPVSYVQIEYYSSPQPLVLMRILLMKYLQEHLHLCIETIHINVIFVKKKL